VVAPAVAAPSSREELQRRIEGLAKQREQVEANVLTRQAKQIAGAADAEKTTTKAVPPPLVLLQLRTSLLVLHLRRRLLLLQLRPSLLLLQLRPGLLCCW
jgi:hypothetical protein